MRPFNGLNYLTANRATLQIRGLEDVEFSVTEFNLPSVELPVAEVQTSFLAGREAGDKPVFGDMDITFIVDEEMKNWKAIWSWIMGLAFKRTSTPRNSEGTITIYSSHNNPIIKFKLSEIIPSYISDIQFRESASETTPVTATARFSLTYYDIDDA